MGTFNCLMDIVSETILRLQSTREVKYQTKIKRDSSADSNNSSLCYPTDFPAYIQEVDATITGFHCSQQTTNTHPEQRDQPDHNVPDLRPLENNTTTPKRNKRRKSQRSNSFLKKKAPIRLDTSTVINLSNVQITDDEILLLFRGLTFCPTPRHIDWAQVKADITDFSRRLRLKEYFYNEDRTCNLKPNPFLLKSTWCRPKRTTSPQENTTTNRYRYQTCR